MDLNHRGSNLNDSDLIDKKSAPTSKLFERIPMHAHSNGYSKSQGWFISQSNDVIHANQRALATASPAGEISARARRPPGNPCLYESEIHVSQSINNVDWNRYPKRGVQE
jgi:hypothetical protein